MKIRKLASTALVGLLLTTGLTATQALPALADESSPLTVIQDEAPQVLAETVAAPEAGTVSTSSDASVSLSLAGNTLRLVPLGALRHQGQRTGLTSFVGEGGGAVVQTTRTGARVMSVVKDRKAAGALHWRIDGPSADTATVMPDGSVQLSASDGTVDFVIAAPWAVDARGAAVATRYVVRGRTLVQQLDVTSQTAFPVVADPSVSFGWNIYIHLNGTDQRALVAGGVAAGAAVAAAVCLELGPGDLFCAAGGAAAGAILGSYVSDNYHPRCTLTLKFRYWGAYAGHSVSNCH